MDERNPGWGATGAPDDGWPRRGAEPERPDERAFGRYRVGELVAAGPWTGVYRARDTTTGYHLALKIATGHTGDPTGRAEFLAQAERARTFEPLTGIQLHDVGQVGEYAYVAYRTPVAASLVDVVSHGPVDPAAAFRLCESIATVLDAAHADGIVHGRLHPGNVLFESTDVFHGRVHVADFALPPADATHAHPYSAPEWRAGVPFDARADVYSLACVLFECLAGTPPLGPRWVDGEYEPWRGGEPPLRLRDVRGDISPALDELLARAMSIDPNDRPVGAVAFVREAEEAARVERAPIETVDGPASRSTRRVHPLAVAAAVTVVAAVGLGLVGARIFGGKAETAASTTTTVPPPRAAELAAAHLLTIVAPDDACAPAALRGVDELAAVACTPADGAVDSYTVAVFAAPADAQRAMARVPGASGNPADASAAPACTYPTELAHPEELAPTTTAAVPVEPVGPAEPSPSTAPPARVPVADHRAWTSDGLLAGRFFCAVPDPEGVRLHFLADAAQLWGYATRADGDAGALGRWWAERLRPRLEGAEAPPAPSGDAPAVTPSMSGDR